MCGVGTDAVYRWLRGVWVGRTRLRLECDVVGHSFRVHPEAVARFKLACREARLGPVKPTPRRESEAELDRRRKRARAARIKACGGN